MEKIRYGMIGGGPGAFVGQIHRMAAAIDGKYHLLAGAFDIDPLKSKQMGEELGLDSKRVYGTYEEMIRAECSLPEDQRVEIVAVTTPNNWHYPMCVALLEAGFNAICEKPMTMNVDEAKKMKAVVENSDRLFALMHNYTGYPMVKQARYMVQKGALGRIQKVVVEYPQSWLLTKLEAQGNMQAAWRQDPRQAGAGGCLGDIGTHAENLARYITGLEIEEVCAELTSFVEGRVLDDDSNILIRYRGGAKGVLIASQISTGQENNFNIRVFGEKGGLHWRQEDPNYLYYTEAGKPMQTLLRGKDYLCLAAQRGNRIPTGHPEGFIEGFANIYRNIADTLQARKEGREPTEIEMDFPDVNDGLDGMRFIETVVESNKSNLKWIRMIK